MATYYVFSGATGANDGSSWTDAYPAFGSAVTAANANGDEILVHKTHAENLGANATYTFAADVRVFCVDKDNSNALAVMGDGETSYIGSNTNTRGITLTGGKNVYLYGIAFRCGGSGSVASGFTLSGDNGAWYLEECAFYWPNANMTYGVFLGTATELNLFIHLKNFTLSLLRNAATARCWLGDAKTIIDGLLLNNVSTLEGLFVFHEQGPLTEIINSDFSQLTTQLVGNSNQGHHELAFSNCRLRDGVTVLGTQTVANRSSVAVHLYNCTSGDQHYHLQHHDAFGSTLVDTGIYANDGASYDGTNRCSWKIVTSADATRNAPYVSPWIDVYHDGTSAITPYLEILRDGSATAFTDAEVWCEFSYQGTSGSTKGTSVHDRAAPRATPANQTASSLGASDWTGENATAWFGKLAPPASFTPAEIGHIRARVCVGAASATVYVDPQIRGLS